MSVRTSITVTDRFHHAMVVEVDGADMTVTYDGERTVELDETDRARLRDFLTVNS